MGKGESREKEGAKRKEKNIEKLVCAPLKFIAVMLLLINCLLIHKIVIIS